MRIPAKTRWRITASSGDARPAIDDLYATAWVSDLATTAWLCIDLGETVTLGGIEVYWGRHWADVYGFETSLDGEEWTPLCGTAHGEGGQNVFAFTPVETRHLRWSDASAMPARALEIVEINLYAPGDAMSVREPSCLSALGQAPVTLAAGDSITVDFGYPRLPLGALIDWGDSWGTVFSVHLSDDGETFREVGRITTSHGDYDNFYWRSTVARYFRLTVHATSTPAGAIIDELKLRLLDKDRMPIGQLERAAAAGRGELYPQALLGRQVYWTVLGEPGTDAEALFDEYGNLEPRLKAGQLTPLLRLEGQLHGAPAAGNLRHSLAEGAWPVPSVAWTCGDIDVEASALAEDGSALVRYRLRNTGSGQRRGALVLAVRPVQINPYWQHGGHAVIHAVAHEERTVRVNEQLYAVFSRVPDAATLADFDHGDVVRLIGTAAQPSRNPLISGSGLVSGAFEFAFELAPGASTEVVVALPMGEKLAAVPIDDFDARRAAVIGAWRAKLGPRRITVGDRDVSETAEAQIALILVNATRHAFKPGPRHYDRTWIRDGASQALALLWAGLIDEAQRYVLWYAARIYPSGLVPPILNPDGSVNRGYGSDIEFDAQGEFVGIAADTYRIGRDRDFLAAIFEPVVRATRFLDELCARTNALHGPASRFHGLLAPSISHEGYNKPTYSYWDNFFALSAWRNCAFLAREMGDSAIAAEAAAKGEAFAAGLGRSIRLTAAAMPNDFIPASADREDVDPTATAIAFEPCRVADVLPAERLQPTYDDYRRHLAIIAEPGFDGGFTPYEIRNLNAFVALGRHEDARALLEQALSWRRPPGWRGWAEVVWGNPRAPEYIGDMPHTWIGAEFFTAIRRMLLRENGTTLELLRSVPDAWWSGDGIRLHELPTSFGLATLTATRERSQACVELSLGGPLPEQIVVRFPGARRAWADGRPCAMDGETILAPADLRRLVIDRAPPP